MRRVVLAENVSSHSLRSEPVYLGMLSRVHGIKSIKANGKTTMYFIHDARLDLPEAP